MVEDIVYVVDDDAPVRESLALLIQSMQWQVKCFSSAGEFLDQLNPEQPGCLILDIRMPEMDGLELQEELNRRGLSIPIIFLTGHGDIQMAVKTLKLGAVDFIEKPFRDQTLLDSIKNALELDQDRRMSSRAAAEFEQRMAKLTPREMQVMNRIVEGQANKVVAAELDVSERTVEIHRSKVMAKMQAQSLAHLVRMVLNHSLDGPAAQQPKPSA